jgi:hypothetical protein
MTRKYLPLVLGLSFAVAVSPQTANVIELAPVDQTRAQRAWEALEKAQSDWEGVQSDLRNKYVSTGDCSYWPSGVQGHGDCVRATKEGFQNGFELSKDFKFIVPKYQPPTYPNVNCPTGVVSGNGYYGCSFMIPYGAMQLNSSQGGNL